MDTVWIVLTLFFFPVQRLVNATPLISFDYLGEMQILLAIISLLVLIAYIVKKSTHWGKEIHLCYKRQHLTSMPSPSLSVLLLTDTFLQTQPLPAKSDLNSL